MPYDQHVDLHGSQVLGRVAQSFPFGETATGSGEIDDVKETINMTVKARLQPMSVIIAVLNKDN